MCKIFLKMEKMKFQVLIKRYVILRGKTIEETDGKLKKIL